jgi:hypothetical protein
LLSIRSTGLPLHRCRRKNVNRGSSSPSLTMARDSYTSAYDKYKAGTKRVTTYLVNTAHRCGVDVVPPGKHQVRTSDYVRLATAIVDFTPQIKVPSHIVTLLNSVIILRKDWSKKNTELIGHSKTACRTPRTATSSQSLSKSLLS